MSEIEPASDERMAAFEAAAKDDAAYGWSTTLVHVDFLLSIIARLRKAERERDEAMAALKQAADDAENRDPEEDW